MLRVDGTPVFICRKPTTNSKEASETGRPGVHGWRVRLPARVTHGDSHRDQPGHGFLRCLGICSHCNGHPTVTPQPLSHQSCKQSLIMLATRGPDSPKKQQWEGMNPPHSCAAVLVPVPPREEAWAPNAACACISYPDVSGCRVRRDETERVIGGVLLSDFSLKCLLLFILLTS